jgi:hypothetical protein
VAKLEEILPKVLTLTKQAKLEWQLVGRNSFRTQVSKLFLAVSHAGNLFEFHVYDDDGNMLKVTAGQYNDPQNELYTVFLSS